MDVAAVAIGGVRQRHEAGAGHRHAAGAGNGSGDHDVGRAEAANGERAQRNVAAHGQRPGVGERLELAVRLTVPAKLLLPPTFLMPPPFRVMPSLVGVVMPPTRPSEPPVTVIGPVPTRALALEIASVPARNRCRTRKRFDGAQSRDAQSGLEQVAGPGNDAARIDDAATGERQVMAIEIHRTGENQRAAAVRADGGVGRQGDGAGHGVRSRLAVDRAARPGHR